MRTKLFVAFMLVAAPAISQTTNCTQLWGTVTCQTHPSDQYGYLRDAGKQGTTQAGQQIGALLNQASQSQQKTIYLWMHGGRIQSIHVCTVEGKCSPGLNVPADMAADDYAKLLDFVSQQANVKLVEI